MNLVLSPTRAIVAVDTLAFNLLVRAEGHLSKLLYVPHLNAILAARGVTFFLAAAWGIVLQQNCTFDELTEGMPQIIPQARKNAEAIVGSAPPPVPTEFIWIGWSEKLSRISGSRFVIQPGSDEVQVTACPDGTALAPQVEIQGSRDLSEPTRMRRVMQNQVEYGKSVEPNGGFGGLMIMAAISRDKAAFDSLPL